MRTHRSRGVALTITMAIAVVATGCWAPSFQPGAYPVVVTSNVVYGRGEVGRLSGGGRFVDLELDLYQPQGTGQTELPLVVVVHGGGFISGSKSEGHIATWARAFAERGFLVASIDYRLTQVEPVPSARVMPLYDALVSIGGDNRQITGVTAIDDTLTALEFLIARPDTNDVQTTLVGGSGGAITVNHVAYLIDDFGIERPPIAAVVSNWGALPLGDGTGYLDNPTPTAEPLFWEPPIFLAHATGDPTVPYQRSVDLAARATEVGLEHRFFTSTATSHVLDLTTERWAPGVSVLEAEVDFVTCTLYPHLAASPECA